MPGFQPLPPDLRSYRPAAVLVMDLVKHTSYDQATTMAVQGVLTDVLGATVASLRLKDTQFNHTGDGYVCTFLGDESARVLDFVNALFPRLTARLGPYDQKIRGGLAFGLLHLRRNLLTQGDTHFDQPGIQAARLEQVASPGQILCTVTVHAIFSRHYPGMFGLRALDIKTKDRDIPAYELLPAPEVAIHIRQYLTSFIFRSPSPDSLERPGALLLIDDEAGMCKALATTLRRLSPEREVLQAGSGAEALAIFSKRACGLVITDIAMYGLNGIEVTSRMRELVPDQIVIGITAYASDEVEAAFYRAGGFTFLLKPFHVEEFELLVKYALSQQSNDGVRRQLELMCDNPVALWATLRGIADSVGGILRLVAESEDVAQQLLRHKTKYLVNDSLARIGPGHDAIDQIRELAIQLVCVERLARIVDRLGIQSIGHFIEALIGDLKKLSPRAEFMLSTSIEGDVKAEIGFGGVVILAIAELIDNALAAAGARGRIEVEIVALRAAGVLRITVRDNGPGVPQGFEERVFEEGISTKGAGRGLGLYLVREAVRILRGSLTYTRSEQTVFCATLPILK